MCSMKLNLPTPTGFFHKTVSFHEKSVLPSPDSFEISHYLILFILKGLVKLVSKEVPAHSISS